MGYLKYYSHNFVDKEVMLHHEEAHDSHGNKDFVDDEGKLALIHQKFLEAKFMSRDEGMRESKQFEDALQVLSSNSDLLLKQLDSQNLCEVLHSTNPQTETKFITLLKPLKMVVGGKGKKNKKMMKKKNPENVDEFLVQSTTRIVVLKPSSGNAAKEITRQSGESDNNFYRANEDGGVLESRKAAKETITQQVPISAGGTVALECVQSRGDTARENSQRSHDETFHSDWSSIFNKDGGNFSNSEAISPPCSPESSVIIEAKKRLHERWNMMESNSKKCNQEEKLHSSLRKILTLGEMLALSPIKKKSVSFSHSIKQEMCIDETVVCCDYGDSGKKSKGMLKLLFHRKVSNFLFSSRKKKSVLSSQHKDESSETLCKNSSDSVSNRQQQQQATIGLEPRLTVSKPEISSENQDQPSPSSVFDPPFEDDNHESLDCMKNGHRGSPVPLKSNLIDKSPPIESIARTLSWDDPCSSLDTKFEEQEWVLFVEKLVSSSSPGLDDDDQFQWHSLESPLDPSLRKKKMRPNQKLVFDFVNAAVLLLKKERRMKCGGAHQTRPQLVDHIVAQMKELIMGGGDLGDCGDSSLENAVRREAVGIGFDELMGLEIDFLGSEIERQLMHELVESVVLDFIGRAQNLSTR